MNEAIEENARIVSAARSVGRAARVNPFPELDAALADLTAALHAPFTHEITNALNNCVPLESVHSVVCQMLERMKTREEFAHAASRWVQDQLRSRRVRKRVRKLSAT